MKITFWKSDFLFVQIVSYCIGKINFKKYFILDYLLRCIRSKSDWKLILDATVAYSCDINFKINYFSIVSFRLYAWKTCHLRHDIGKVWETWGYKFASIHRFNSVIVMLHVDETPVKDGI